MMAARVLLLDVDSGSALAEELRELLETAGPGFEVCRGALTTPAEQDLLLHAVERERADLVCLVLPADLNAVGSLSALDLTDLPAPVLALTASDAPTDLLELLHRGVCDFIRPPLRRADLLPRLWRQLERRPAAPSWTDGLRERVGLRRLVGRSPTFARETAKIPLLARCDLPVLICGETGTGKELVARGIHYLGPRSAGPFVPVNCGAIPVDLVENELFGHERSAYTGAHASRSGLIEEADGGTLFLDEIDCLPPTAQVKLLRFLQEGEFRRLGSNRVRTSDARVVAASNAEIERALASGHLRRDLYYRINVLPLNLPPLRRRREDVPLLAEHFRRSYNQRLGRAVRGFSPEALEVLLRYDWPGNVRELEHVVQRAVLLAEGRALVEAADLGFEPRPEQVTTSFVAARQLVLERFEREFVEQALAIHHGNITRAAQAAGRSRRGFWELLRKHGIDADRFRGLSL